MRMRVNPMAVLASGTKGAPSLVQTSPGAGKPSAEHPIEGRLVTWPVTKHRSTLTNRKKNKINAIHKNKSISQFRPATFFFIFRVVSWPLTDNKWPTTVSSCWLFSFLNSLILFD
jgi:hypothetical protein